MNRPKGFVFIVAGIVIGVLLAFLFRSPTMDGSSRTGMVRTAYAGGSVNINSPAPVFDLPDLSAKRTTLEQLAGRAVVLNFWTTWCDACLEEMPVLDDLYRNHSADLIVIGLDVGEDPDAVAAYLEEHPVQYPILLDPTAVTGAIYQVLGYPTTYFLDREGIIRAKHVGTLTPRLLETYLISLGIDL